MSSLNVTADEFHHVENEINMMTNKVISYDSLPKKKELSYDDNTENYETKQKELSSVYYIKSNPKPKLMSIYDETKAKNLSSRHNFSATSLQRFRSIDDLMQRQQKPVIQNDILKFNSKEFLYQESLKTSFNPDIDINTDDYIQSLRIAATKLKNQQLSNYPNKILPPTTTPTSYPEDLSSSYASLDCPPPPPCISEKNKDPQTRLISYFKTLYIEHAIKEPILPSWVHQIIMPTTLSPARLEPELRFSSLSHGLNEIIPIDQILAPIQVKDGSFLEAPKRVFIECPSWMVRSSLALRILYNWAKDDVPWPQKGQPVLLALFISLNEVKGSLQSYITKELMTKNFVNFFSNSTWNILESLGVKLLLIIDTNDATLSRSSNKSHKNSCDDIANLLEGRLLPDTRLILLGGSSQSNHLLQFTQRHIKYEGISWGRSALLLGGGQWGASTRLLDLIQKSQFLKCVARSPLGCLAIAQIYESNAGQFEVEDEVDIIESFINIIAPNIKYHQPYSVELGRLALFCLKMKHSGFSTSELKLYCSAPDSPFIGCFEKCQLFGKTAKKRGEFLYSPMCSGILEFLAATYLVSLANRPEILAAEIAGLSFIDDIVEADILKVLKFAMTLLADRAYVLLTKLTVLWLSPQTVFSLALAATETESNLNALCDMLGITKVPSISPLETNPIWVSITSSVSELQGWSLALKSSECALKNLELMYQFEKTIQIESRNALNIFLDALSGNESVTTLRISSLIENDVQEKDINFLAVSISRALLKPKLENFELILTQLEEDPPAMKLQSVVSALCKSIPKQTKLVSLLLDLGLGTSQLIQICSALERCPHVSRLSLPHLKCERGAVFALASLLRKRPLISLSLPACWGARDDPPSSSGVSMGSGTGSGSSSGASGLIKQSSLSGTHSPRGAYTPGIFCSLPRGVQPVSTLGRSQTLPRQLLESVNDKRSQDSVFSTRSWVPTPSCEGQHSSGTLHELLCAAREPSSRLNGLDLSKAQLSLEDSMCLGETVRTSSTLHSLKVEGASRVSEILPSILGASESPCLQMLNFASPRLVLEDAAISMSAKALSCCSTLRLLSLDGWSFKFDNVVTLSQARCFLSVTHVREIGMSNCKIHLPFTNSTMKPPTDIIEFPSIVVLKLAGTQIILSDQTPIRGPQILPYLKGFRSLRELDLSAPIRSGIGSSSSSVPPLILDDKSITSFFSLLSGKSWSLNTLKICNWIVHLDDVSKTLKSISKSLKSSTLSHMKIDGISILDRSKRFRAEPQFLHTLISSIPHLRWISVSLAGLNEEHIGLIGKSIRDIKSPEIDIRLNDSTIENVRLMTQSLSSDGKFDIRVSTFGTSSNILLHVEKIGGKSSLLK